MPRSEQLQFRSPDRAPRSDRPRCRVQPECCHRGDLPFCSTPTWGSADVPARPCAPARYVCMETVYSEGVSTDPESDGDGTVMGTSRWGITIPAGPPAGIRGQFASIEPVFAMAPSHHERLFGVKSFFERVFAFDSPPHYLHTNRCSTGEGPREAASAAVARGPRSCGRNTGRDREKEHDGPGIEHQA